MAVLDAMSAEETALLKQMKAEDAAAGPMPERGTEPGTPASDDPQPKLSQPEAAQAEKPTDPAAAEKQEVVDKRALDAERERRRKAEKEARDQEKRHAAELARVQERLELLSRAAEQHVAPKPEPVAPPPDFNADPAAYIKYNFDTLQQKQAEYDRRLAELNQNAQQINQRQQETHQIAEVEAWGQRQEAEFAQQTPDYADAMKHLMKSVEAQHRRLGTADGDIPALVRRDVVGLANLCRAKGLPFGETLYGMAQDRGYAPSASRAAEAPSQQVAGATRANSDNAAERLLRGQDMATTLGSTGSAPRGETSVNVIASMSEEEFSKLYSETKKRGGAAMRGLFGE